MNRHPNRSLALAGLAFGLLLAMGAPALAQQVAGEDNDSGPPLAKVCGQTLTAKDITPPPKVLELQRQTRTTDDYQQWLTRQRITNFRQQILDTLVADHLELRNIAATEEQLRQAESFLQRFRADRKERLQRRLDELSKLRSQAVARGLSVPAEQEREAEQIREGLAELERLGIYSQPGRTALHEGVQKGTRTRAKALVDAWIFRKAIYEEFGGLVVSSNRTYEPVEGYEAWIAILENEGKLWFADPAQSESFKRSLSFAGLERIEAPEDAYAKPPWIGFYDKLDPADKADDAVPNPGTGDEESDDD